MSTHIDYYKTPKASVIIFVSHILPEQHNVSSQSLGWKSVRHLKSIARWFTVNIIRFSKLYFLTIMLGLKYINYYLICSPISHVAISVSIIRRWPKVVRFYTENNHLEVKMNIFQSDANAKHSWRCSLFLWPRVNTKLTSTSWI